MLLNVNDNHVGNRGDDYDDYLQIVSNDYSNYYVCIKNACNFNKLTPCL